MSQRTCGHCDEDFTGSPFHPEQKYCSTACQRKAGHARAYLDHTCVVCGKVWRSRRPNVKLCSSPCRSS